MPLTLPQFIQRKVKQLLRDSAGVRTAQTSLRGQCLLSESFILHSRTSVCLLSVPTTPWLTLSPMGTYPTPRV